MVPNTFDVQLQGQHVHIKRGLGAQVLTYPEALNLAAHLVAHAETSEDEFARLLEEVQDSLGQQGDTEEGV